MPRDEGLLGSVMHLWTGMLHAYNRNKNLYRALISHTIFQPAGETPGMAKQSEECIRFLSAMIEEQKTSGAVRSETDTAVAAASLFFLYMGALVAFFRMPEAGVEEVASFLSSMTKQYLQGILVVRDEDTSRPACSN